MIRQKNIAPRSRVGIEHFAVYVANTGVGSGPEGVLPIALCNVSKVELIELGCAVEGTLTGTDLKARLERQGNAGFQASGTLVAESSAAGDVNATDEWGIQQLSPPTVIPVDYTDAATKLNRDGYGHGNIGNVKLSLRKGGAATAFTGWVWCTLRITRIEDL